MIYSTGYNGWKEADLFARIDESGLTVLDIRYTPWSHRQTWCKPNLQARLGARYVHVLPWGNDQYHSSGVLHVTHFADGLELAAPYLARGPVLLLCACRYRETCHRSVLANLLAQHGYPVDELPHPEDAENVLPGMEVTP